MHTDVLKLNSWDLVIARARCCSPRCVRFLLNALSVIFSFFYWPFQKSVSVNQRILGTPQHISYELWMRISDNLTTALVTVHACVLDVHYMPYVRCVVSLVTMHDTLPLSSTTFKVIQQSILTLEKGWIKHTSHL